MTRCKNLRLLEKRESTRKQQKCVLKMKLKTFCFLSGCINLTHLWLEELDISDEDLSKLLSNGSRFVHLSLRRLSAAGNLTAKAISECSADSLRSLDISFCRNFNTSAVGMVADSCNSLAEIYVWGCTQLNNNFYYGHSNDNLKIKGSPKVDLF